ncbi:MAG: hypothetical protein HZA03_08180 [Nitrospinae bacterium]|nr:hypothetical protein [Nitrospinota bacterium]
MKGSMKNRIAAAALALAFAGIAFFLFQRQVGEVYLKSGKRLHEGNNPGAAELLRPASRYACANPAAHRFLAAALQKEAMAASGSDARLPLIEGEAALKNALAIRADGAALMLLGQNRALDGRFDDALEAYNAAFFLSQKAADAEGWNDLRQYQPAAARAAFGRGALGPPLIIAYNHFSGYAPFAPKNAVTELLESFFKTVPPERWRGAAIDRDGPALKTPFAARDAGRKREIIDALRRENFGFLADYLEGA